MDTHSRGFVILGVGLFLFVLLELYVVYGIPRYRAWREKRRPTIEP